MSEITMMSYKIIPVDDTSVEDSGHFGAVVDAGGETNGRHENMNLIYTRHKLYK